jgi:hypothetical protein
MKPIHFKESNKCLLKPHPMADEDCKSLDVWTDNVECISCWRPSFSDIIRIVLFRKIWVRVLSGYTQPPVSIETPRVMFHEKKIQSQHQAQYR